MSKLLTFLILGFIFISYQNCGKQMSFSSQSFDSKDGNIVPIDNNEDVPDVNDGTDDVVDDNTDVPDDNDDTEIVDDGHSCHSSSKPEYICILAGSGKSQKLGFVDGDLVSKNATPSTVCTTKKACLEIVSQEFEVIEAKKAGFCKHGAAHTVAFSEEELLNLINK